MLMTFFYWLAVLRLKLRLWLISVLKKPLYLELEQFSFSLKIKTEDSEVIRQVKLSNGKISSTSGLIQLVTNTPNGSEDSNSITVTFKSNSDAFKIARALKKEKEKIFEFIQEQRVKIEGDFSVLQTLMQLKDKLDNP